MRMGLWTMAICALLGMQATYAKEEFLEPDQAFHFSAQAIDDHTIAASFDIADHYYLYRERFKFAAEKENGGLKALLGQVTDAPAHASEHPQSKLLLGEPLYPQGKIKFDETFQKNVEHYRHRVVVRIPVLAGTPQQFLLKATYQGCADAGLCYAPIDKVAMVNLAMPVALHDDGNGIDQDLDIDESSRIARTLHEGRLWAIAAIFIGLGVLLSFTPCILPMLPILSAIIVGQGQAHQITRRRGLALAAAYSLGMALVYTCIGITAGLIGEGLSAALQNAWMLGAFAVLLVLLSLSMFGVYSLQVPASMQARLTQWSGQIGTDAKGDDRLKSAVHQYGGVFVMGAISTLIIGPCIAAPLAGTLIYISQTRNVIIGGLALFSLAVGMSLPLLLLGVSAGSLLPRVGPWMNGVKRLFGVILLAVAYWIVMPVLPQWLRLDVLSPASLDEQLDASIKPVRFERIRSNAELDHILQSSAQPILLDFYADWCVSCKEMERYTYTDARVAAQMQRYRLLQVDVTANTNDDKALMKRFNLFGPPGTLFFDREGRAIEGARIIGFQKADVFLASLQTLAQ